MAAENPRQYGLPAFADYANVIHYGRFSSLKQAAGTSEERQLDKADQWAAREGVVFTDRLIDRGKSGYHGKHRTEGDFGTLLQLVTDRLLPTPALVGPEGWLYWRVIPDNADNGEACWDARSLHDARETIDAELEALEAKNLSDEQHASASIGGQR